MVDFPAPFSPISAVTSPALRSNADVMQRAHAGKTLRNAGKRAARTSPLRREHLAIDLRCPAGDGRLREVRDLEGTADQKILANFSTFDLSKMKGSPIAASPSSPILVSPMRPIFTVEPGSPGARRGYRP